MTKITANEFFEAYQAEWAALCAQEPINGLTPYKNRSAWTERMLKRNGFLHRVMHRLSKDERPLEYRTEWYSVDALYVGGQDIYGKELSYPSEVHALIEHEFNEDLETEMWKLIHWRAPLKVIINYDWSEDEKTTTARKEYVTRKLEKLRHMHSVVDEFHPENPETEYLFLMGTRKAIDGEIIWCRV